MSPLYWSRGEGISAVTERERENMNNHSERNTASKL